MKEYVIVYDTATTMEQKFLANNPEDVIKFVTEGQPSSLDVRLYSTGHLTQSIDAINIISLREVTKTSINIDEIS